MPGCRSTEALRLGRSCSFNPCVGVHWIRPLACHFAAPAGTFNRRPKSELLIALICPSSPPQFGSERGIAHGNCSQELTRRESGQRCGYPNSTVDSTNPHQMHLSGDEQFLVDLLRNSMKDSRAPPICRKLRGAAASRWPQGTAWRRLALDRTEPQQSQWDEAAGSRIFRPR